MAAIDTRARLNVTFYSCLYVQLRRCEVNQLHSPPEMGARTCRHNARGGLPFVRHRSRKTTSPRDFQEESDSPVREDWSTSREPCIISASAATMSPALSFIKSPGTSSLDGINDRLPFLLTRLWMLNCRFRLDIACLAFPSLTNTTAALKSSSDIMITTVAGFPPSHDMMAMTSSIQGIGPRMVLRVWL